MVIGVIKDNGLLQSVRTDVDQLLTQYFTCHTDSAGRMSKQYARLWQTIERLNSAGGKRLRPYMMVLAYESCGGDDRESIMPVAAAWELLHLSMLIHDDIIDNDLVRHGIKNIAGSYRDYYRHAETGSRRDHLASGAALLAGDLMLSSAHQLVLESSLRPEAKILAQQYLTVATFAVAGGELMDTESTLNPVLAADPLSVARYKTASYSFIGPLSCGAALAGASEDTLKEIERFGEALGCAFQLTDDLLGVFGDPAVTGKSNRGDLSEGKPTYMLQQAYRLAGADEQKRLQQLVGKADLDEAEADEARRIIVACGARQAAEKLIDDLAHQAESAIARLPFDDRAATTLRQLVTAATHRNY